MTICGYYRNPLENIKNMYAEVYTHESFIHTYNPGLSPDRDIIYVKLNNLDFSGSGMIKRKKWMRSSNCRGQKVEDIR